jgi:hypothetical protein
MGLDRQDVRLEHARWLRTADIVDRTFRLSEAA